MSHAFAVSRSGNHRLQPLPSRLQLGTLALRRYNAAKGALAQDQRRNTGGGRGMQKKKVKWYR